MKNLKKFAALALSASMVMGMTLTGMAAEPEVSVDAPIYAYDITNVVVPTTFAVAFNPDGLAVIKNGDESNPITSQIVSKNYGIINKSTKDKVITVTLKVEDLNEGKIEFVETAAAATGAAADAYAINLTLVPADATEVKVGSTPATADLTTTGADLADVAMTAAATTKTLVAGENEVDFLLTKAEYDGKIDLDSAKDNNVAADFTLIALAASGKGITAFTFGGAMNAKADWTKLTKGIKITAVYSNENAPDGATAVTNTGALYENPYPVFKAGAAVGTIKYRTGTGNDALSTIKSIKIADASGKYYDGYNAGSKYKAATDLDGLITFDSVYFNPFITKNPNDLTIEAVITYETEGGEEKTATVNVRLKAETAPTFTAGSAVGSINYTNGIGSVALKSIKKIEIADATGKYYDGYNAGGKYSAATDVDGVVTFDSVYFTPYVTKNPSSATIEALITYETVGGAEKTATVDVKLR